MQCHSTETTGTPRHPKLPQFFSVLQKKNKFQDKLADSSGFDNAKKWAPSPGKSTLISGPATEQRYDILQVIPCGVIVLKLPGHT